MTAVLESDVTTVLERVRRPFAVHKTAEVR